MLSNLVKKLRSDGAWVQFESFFEEQIQSELKELKGKAPDITTGDVIKLNITIELFERLKKLDSWDEKLERGRSKK